MNEFKFINKNLDISNKYILKQELERLENLYVSNTIEEQGIKIFLNSIYGSLASDSFFGFNIKMAEAITLQGQDIIKFSSDSIQKSLEIFCTKKEIYSKFGIENINLEKIKNKNFIIYNDTDSVFIEFGSIIESCTPKITNEIDFIRKLIKKVILPYVNKDLENYAKLWNCKENLLKLDFDGINFNIFLLKKKKYFLHKAWKASGENGIFYKKLEKFSYKGIEIAKSINSKFVRNILKEIIKQIVLLSENSISQKDFYNFIDVKRNAFDIANIEDISFNQKLTDYEKYVEHNSTTYVLKPKCPIHIRASAFYNYLILKNKLLNLYVPIVSGNKIKFYYTKNAKDIVFAYLPNSFPKEIAPEINKDIQWEKLVLDPINRILESVNLPILKKINFNSLF